jgi:hypothetical protein
MGASVSNVYVQTYETHVRFIAQQGVTRLDNWTMQKSVQSEGHNWELLGTQEATIKSGRLVSTPEQDYPWSRRKSIPVVRHTGDTTEQEDITQMLLDPNSNIASAQGMAMRRGKDDEIIAAATGDSRDGAGDPVLFRTGANIPVGTHDQVIGDYSTPLNFDKITAVSELFMKNDIDPDEPKCIVIGPTQARKLLQLTEATSGDYNAVRPLTSKGYIESWMGYSWVVSTRLLNPTAPGTDVDCFALTKKAIGMQTNKDIWCRVAEDPTKSFAWRIYCAMQNGAVRVEDAHLVWLKLADTL